MSARMENDRIEQIEDRLKHQKDNSGFKSSKTKFRHKMIYLAESKTIL